MDDKFYCPNCRCQLNIEKNIFFTVSTADGNKSVLVLSTRLGDYSVKQRGDIEIKKGEKVVFQCPHCDEDLTAKDVNENLARVILRDDEGNEHQILFSMVAGEYCTYKIGTDNSFISYGDDASMYVNDLN